jgi:uncharacterized paraquat-inducible protein A
MKNYETLKSLIDGAMPVVEIWKAETPAQEVWKEKWLRQAREVVDKPKEYCTCIGLRINNANDKNCLRCGKPIKTEKIEPLEQCYNDGKHFIVTSTSAVINKLNEVIDHINKKGV